MQNALITRWELMGDEKFQALLIPMAQYLSQVLPVESEIVIYRDFV